VERSHTATARAPRIRVRTGSSRLLLCSARRLMYEDRRASTWLVPRTSSAASPSRRRPGLLIATRDTIHRRVRSSTGDRRPYGFTNQEADGTGLVHFSYRRSIRRSAGLEARRTRYSQRHAGKLGALENRQRLRLRRQQPANSHRSDQAPDRLVIRRIEVVAVSKSGRTTRNPPGTGGRDAVPAATSSRKGSRREQGGRGKTHTP